MTIQISAISNAFLREAANNANTNVVDDFIDDKEKVDFEDAAHKVWEQHDCTNDEYKAIFGYTPTEKPVKTLTSQEEIAKMDSVYNYNKNSDEGKSIYEIRDKIKENEFRMNKIQDILTAKDFDYNEYSQYFNKSLEKTKLGISVPTVAAGGLLSAGIFSGFFGGESKITDFLINNLVKSGVVFGIGMLAFAGTFVYGAIKAKNSSEAEINAMRAECKQEYQRLAAENNRLNEIMKKFQ